MRLHPGERCRCTRPARSGRIYYRWEACVGCGFLIPRSSGEREQIERWEDEIIAQERELRVGGVDHGGIPSSAKSFTQRRVRRGAA